MPGFVTGNVRHPDWTLPLRSCQGSGGDGDRVNPEDQGSDAAWAVALQGKEHSPTQGPREGCLELAGKSGEELSRQREQHVERAMGRKREGSLHGSV